MLRQLCYASQKGTPGIVQSPFQMCGVGPGTTFLPARKCIEPRLPRSLCTCKSIGWVFVKSQTVSSFSRPPSSPQTNLDNQVPMKSEVPMFNGSNSNPERRVHPFWGPYPIGKGNKHVSPAHFRCDSWLQPLRGCFGPDP